MLLWYPRLPGRQSEVPAPETRQLFAQIQPHSGGIVSVTAIAAGEAPVEDPGELMSGDADSVVTDGELYLFSQRPCGDLNHRIFSAVAGGILEKLAQNEGGPFFIGIHKAFQSPGLYPGAALDQEGAVICHSLIHDFRQPYPAQNAVPLRASHPA